MHLAAAQSVVHSTTSFVPELVQDTDLRLHAKHTKPKTMCFCRPGVGVKWLSQSHVWKQSISLSLEATNDQLDKLVSELQESTFPTISASPAQGLERGTATPHLYTVGRDQNSGPYICALSTWLFPQPPNLFFRQSAQIQQHIETRDTSLKGKDSPLKDGMLLEDYSQSNNKPSHQTAS